MSDANHGPGCGSRACTVSANSCSAYLCSDVELMVIKCVWLLLWGSMANSFGHGVRLARHGSPARPGEARADMTQAVVAGTGLSLAGGLSSSELLPPSIPGSPWWQQAAVQGWYIWAAAPRCCQCILSLLGTQTWPRTSQACTPDLQSRCAVQDAA